VFSGFAVVEDGELGEMHGDADKTDGGQEIHDRPADSDVSLKTVDGINHQLNRADDAPPYCHDAIGLRADSRPAYAGELANTEAVEFIFAGFPLASFPLFGEFGRAVFGGHEKRLATVRAGNKLRRFTGDSLDFLLAGRAAIKSRPWGRGFGVLHGDQIITN
jgi:hypothetical protein